MIALTELSEERGTDLRSVRSSQLIERIDEVEYREKMHRDPPDASAPRTVTYYKLPGVPTPRRPEPRAWHDSIVGVPFPNHGADAWNEWLRNKKGPAPDRPWVDPPKPSFPLGPVYLTTSHEGLHTADKACVHHTTDTELIALLDIIGNYPSLIALKHIVTQVFGDIGRDVYCDLLRRRQEYKARTVNGGQKT